MSGAARTLHPYRVRAGPAIASLAHLRRRRHSHLGGVLVLWFLVGRLVVTPLAVGSSPPDIGLWPGLAVAVATWLFTSELPTDPRKVRWLAWVLRVLAIAEPSLVLLDLLAPDLGFGISRLRALLCLSLLPATGLLFVAYRFASLANPKRFRVSCATGLAFLASGLAAIADWQPPTLALIVWCGYPVYVVVGLLWTLKLLHAERVVLHEAWLDTKRLPAVHWLSSVVLADGNAEVLTAKGEHHRFPSYADAIDWLDKRGFIDENQALARALVTTGPTTADTKEVHVSLDAAVGPNASPR